MKNNRFLDEAYKKALNIVRPRLTVREKIDALPVEQKERAELLYEALKRLDVKDGVANKLMGYGHFGVLGDPIWKYLYMLNTTKRSVKNKGAWLMKCMMNEKVKT